MRWFSQQTCWMCRPLREQVGSPHRRSHRYSATISISTLDRYPLQSPGLARILRRLSVSRHFLRFPQ
ncbi:hypothetical protein E3W21_15835 [Pseudomonas sp. F01002]|nr:hypothetical protein E3W21_15835 [Pseudomonas sp. F01002]